MTEEKKHKRVLFADLDGTLIETIFGNTFPKGIWDMQFKWDVLQAIKDYGFEVLLIVSNQGGIEKGFVVETMFLTKSGIHLITHPFDKKQFEQEFHFNFGNDVTLPGIKKEGLTLLYENV